MLNSFSITKWIHLNHGDAGLLAFFKRIFDSLKLDSGAKLVLEPQHWDSYAKAKRMDVVSSLCNAPTLPLKESSCSLDLTEVERER